jgi:hypothetical protein
MPTNCGSPVQGTDVPLDVGGRQAVHAGGPGSLVARDPVKRHHQRRRVVYEVEQVVEPAARIGRRPTGEVWSAFPIPDPTSPQGTLRSGRCHSAAHLLTLQSPSLLVTATALPHVPGFPRLGVLRRLRPVPARLLSADGGPTPRQPCWKHGRWSGPEQFPCSLLTACRSRCPTLSRQHRHGYAAGIHRGLPGLQTQTCPEVPRSAMKEQVRAASGPDPPDFGPVTHYGT